MKELSKPILIIGAGIGGLSAGARLKELGCDNFIIADKCKTLPNNLHNGLHYLHNTDLHLPFEFEFKKIILTEEVWSVKTNEFKKQATIPEMFEYSKKLMENVRHPSSIMDPGKQDSVWIPMSNNMNDLINSYYDYIGEEHFKWEYELDSVELSNKIAKFKNGQYINYSAIISTAPANKFYEMFHFKSPFNFKNKTLYVTNYKTTNIVPNWLIVIYISDPKFKPYRITVMNNILSMESLEELTHDDEIIIKYHIEDMFEYELSSRSSYAWETGRIFGLDKKEREMMVDQFKDIDIFLLGRYATWNGKIRMDDTARDAISIVDKIIKDN